QERARVAKAREWANAMARKQPALSVSQSRVPEPAPKRANLPSSGPTETALDHWAKMRSNEKYKGDSVNVKHIFHRRKHFPCRSGSVRSPPGKSGRARQEGDLEELVGIERRRPVELRGADQGQGLLDTAPAERLGLDGGPGSVFCPDPHPAA